MQLETTRFGTIEVNPESVFTFPKGIIQLEGFEDCTRYTLFHEEGSTSPLHYLQSLDDPELSFTLIDPAILSVDYKISLSDDECELLHFEEGDVVEVMLMVYRPLHVEGEEVTQDPHIKAQTRSPLVVNVNKRLGFQKIGLNSRLIFTNMEDEA
jgi:flagellar assembly factor FliW